MKEYKLVFTGTTGAGKTTAINAISETPTINTDVVNTDAEFDKATTTVGLDFGQVTMENGDRLRLYGTPGQSRFDFMWSILAKDAFGIVILIDNSRPDPLADLDVYLEGFKAELANVPCVIGVGRTENHRHPSLDDFAARLEKHGYSLPILDVDVRRAEDVLMLLDMLITLNESQLCC